MGQYLCYDSSSPERSTKEEGRLPPERPAADSMTSIKTYVCSPLTAPTRRERLANAALAASYMAQAEAEFGGRAVAPHAYLPQLLDDTVPEERALALEFGLKLLGLCSQLVVYGPRISQGMRGEIEAAKQMGIPVLYRLTVPKAKKEPAA